MRQWMKILSAAVILSAVSAVHAQQGPPGGGGQGGPGGPGGPGGGPGGGPDGDGGPPDPRQMTAMMDKRIQENMDLSDEAWAKIQPLVDKVTELENETDMHHIMGHPHPNDDGNGPPDDQEQQPHNEVEAALSKLKHVLSDKSSTDEKILAATKAVEDAEKKAADELADARKALKAAVDARQAAVLVAMGVLN